MNFLTSQEGVLLIVTNNKKKKKVSSEEPEVLTTVCSNEPCSRQGVKVQGNEASDFHSTGHHTDKMAEQAAVKVPSTINCTCIV